MADRLARDLMAMAPLQQMMQRMREQAEHAQQEAVREREAAQAQPVARPSGLTVHSAEDFEF